MGEGFSEVLLTEEEEDSLEWGITILGMPYDETVRRQSVTVQVDPFDLIRRSRSPEAEIPF